MPDNLANDTQIAEQTEVKQPVSFGKVEKVQMVIPKDIPTEITDNNIENTNGANAILDANKGVDTKEKAAPAPTMPTSEQLKEYFKSLDIEYDGDEKIKQKLTPTTTAEPTPEQKEAQAKAREKRVIDKFIANGNSVEQYVGIKAVAEGDEKELSIAALKNELKQAKFSDTEIEAIIKERYYQFSDEEIDEQYTDETDKEFAKRKKEYGANKLATRSIHTKTQAQGILSELQSEIELEDLRLQQQVAISAKIDEDFKALPRKLYIEIGEIGGKTTSPVDYDVSEEDLSEVHTMMKDPVQLKQFLYHKDGSLNTTNLVNVLARNKVLESAAKISFLTGMTKGIADALKDFKGSATELGVGGITTKPNQTNGTPAGFGKVQRVQPQR